MKFSIGSGIKPIRQVVGTIRPGSMTPSGYTFVNSRSLSRPFCVVSFGRNFAEHRDSAEEAG